MALTNDGDWYERPICPDADTRDRATIPHRRPVVERIAGWSARHRAIALVGWLFLVAGAVVIGNTPGTKNLNSYDPGDPGRPKGCSAGLVIFHSSRGVRRGNTVVCERPPPNIGFSMFLLWGSLWGMPLQDGRVELQGRAPLGVAERWLQTEGLATAGRKTS